MAADAKWLSGITLDFSRAACPATSEGFFPFDFGNSIRRHPEYLFVSCLLAIVSILVYTFDLGRLIWFIFTIFLFLFLFFFGFCSFKEARWLMRVIAVEYVTSQLITYANILLHTNTYNYGHSIIT